MSRPFVTIDLEKIEHNARTITRLCGKYGIEVTGVTKVTCGMPQVGKAMLRGGVAAIGESRMENILRLKANGVNAPYMLLRIPPLSAVEDIVTSVDISLNSELSVIAALSEAAHRRGLIHKIIIMVDLGDLREGVWPDDLLPMARDIMELPGVRIVGLGAKPELLRRGHALRGEHGQAGGVRPGYGGAFGDSTPVCVRREFKRP